ncbi:MAG TPA: autotransporter outer membrane beta-barrel domain-containing protein [Rhizobacter sp.]|nr:autotransporter outer membrane beta-barrel domain-containing protein [Rhizobacter sp.]
MKTPSFLQQSHLALLPCFLSVAASASAAIDCSPTAAGTSADIVSLQGHCVDTITNLQLSAGSEIWRVQSSAGDQAAGTRVLPNGSLDVVKPTIPGDYTYYITTIDPGYGGPIDLASEGGYPSVTLTVADPCAPSSGGAAGRVHVAKRSPLDVVCPSGQTTLDQVSSTLTTVQTERMRSHLSQAQERLRLLRNSRTIAQFDVQGIPLPESKKNEGDGPRKGRLGIYIVGLGDYLRQNGSPGQSQFDARTTTVSVGVDYRLNDDWVMGGNVGMSDSHVGFTDSASDQKSRGNQATVYASWSLSPATYVSATLSYEASRFDLTRDDGSGQVSFASPRGHGVGLSLSAGHDFVMGPWSVGPYLRWDRVTSDVDAFDETGSASAVSVGSQRTQSNTLNLGAQTQFSVPVSWGVLLPYVRAELSHRNDATRKAATATLLSDNTTLLIPTAAETSNHYGSLAVGVSGLHQRGISWFLDCESGLAQKDYRTQRFGLGLRFEL